MSINPLLVSATHGAVAHKAAVPRSQCGYRDERFRTCWLFGWDWMDDRLSDPKVKAELLDESTILAQLTEAIAEKPVSRGDLQQMPIDRLVIWLIHLARGERE